MIDLLADGIEWLGKLIFSALTVAVIGFAAGYGATLGVAIALGI